MLHLRVGTIPPEAMTAALLLFKLVLDNRLVVLNNRPVVADNRLIAGFICGLMALVLPLGVTLVDLVTKLHKSLGPLTDEIPVKVINPSPAASGAIQCMCDIPCTLNLAQL